VISIQLWLFTLLRIPQSSFPQLSFKGWDIQSSYPHLTVSFEFITEALRFLRAIQGFLRPQPCIILFPLYSYINGCPRFESWHIRYLTVRHHLSGRHCDITSENMDLITSIKVRKSGTLPPRHLHGLTTGSYTKWHLFDYFLPIRYNAFG